MKMTVKIRDFWENDAPFKNTGDTDYSQTLCISIELITKGYIPANGILYAFWYTSCDVEESYHAIPPLIALRHLTDQRRLTVKVSKKASLVLNILHHFNMLSPQGTSCTFSTPSKANVKGVPPL
jgi:hypothetical protein